MEQSLFVYGTLAPGRPNEHVLSHISGTWQPASVTGQLIQGGWGAEMGYPGIFLTADGQKVEGFLFSSEHLDQYWPYLDEFEGEGYERVLTKVTTQSGQKINAYIYQLIMN